MAKMTPEQWRQYAAHWKRVGPELDRLRREELRNWKYDSRIVDALLEIGARLPRREEEPNGLVEMQRWFIKFAQKKGLLPTVVRESPRGYSGDGRRAVPARSDEAGDLVYIVGDAAILDRPKIALFCSVRCPGKLILDTYDLAKQFRERGVTVISGFHSPMEEECLRILLRSPHPVVWCIARGLYRQIPTKPVDCRAAVADGRLVMVTPFANTVRHITIRTANARNRLVVEMASAVVVAHAAPGSKMEALCREILAAGKPLYTFDHPANAALIQAGACAITSDTDWNAILSQVSPSDRGRGAILWETRARRESRRT